jgi:hypothetical protein
MDGVGHLPYEEAPSEFNNFVCDFLLRSNPRTPLEDAGKIHPALHVPTSGVPADEGRRQVRFAG